MLNLQLNKKFACNHNGKCCRLYRALLISIGGKETARSFRSLNFVLHWGMRIAVAVGAAGCVISRPVIGWNNTFRVWRNLELKTFWNYTKFSFIPRCLRTWLEWVRVKTMPGKFVLLWRVYSLFMAGKKTTT